MMQIPHRTYHRDFRQYNKARRRRRPVRRLPWFWTRLISPAHLGRLHHPPNPGPARPALSRGRVPSRFHWM